MLEFLCADLQIRDLVQIDVTINLRGLRYREDVLLSSTPHTMHSIGVSGHLIIYLCRAPSVLLKWMLQVKHSLHHLISFTDLIINAMIIIILRAARVIESARWMARSLEKSLVLMTSSRVRHKSKLLVLRRSSTVIGSRLLLLLILLQRLVLLRCSIRKVRCLTGVSGVNRLLHHRDAPFVVSHAVLGHTSLGVSASVQSSDLFVHVRTLQ